MLLLLGFEEADGVFQVLHCQPLVLKNRLDVVRLRARRLARFAEKDRCVVHLSGGCSRLHRRLSQGFGRLLRLRIPRAHRAIGLRLECLSESVTRLGV